MSEWVGAKMPELLVRKSVKLVEKQKQKHGGQSSGFSCRILRVTF